MQFSAKRIRLQADNALDRIDAVNVLTNDTPRAARGTSLVLEVGLFNNGTIVDDVANISSVTVELRDPSCRDIGPIRTETVAVGDLTAAPGQAAWDAGTAEHVRIELDKDWSDIEVGNEEKSFELTFSVLTVDVPVECYTPIQTALVIFQDGTGTAALGSNYYTAAQADARFVALLPPFGNYRFKDVDGTVYFQAWNQETSKFQTAHLEGQPGAEHWIFGAQED